ncbi:MAG: PepSY domain-containing protein [Rhodospirillaceae bacterium]|nr:PepSY domain-containing protein [Rhodospirillaceae bacterium]
MNKVRNWAVGLIALTAVAGAALAQPAPPAGPLPSPTVKAMALSDIVKKLEEGGYSTIREIERTRGLWVVRALDQGGELRALTVDPISGAISEPPPRPPQMRHEDERGRRMPMPRGRA